MTNKQDRTNYTKTVISCCLIGLFWSLSFHAFAQFPGNFNTSGGGGAGPSSNVKEYAGPPRDSAIQVFYLDDLKNLQQAEDTTIDYLHLYDPILITPFEHYNIGDLGQAHRSFMYQPRIRKGVDLGYHSYDLYFLKHDDIPFLNNEIPYADLRYSQATSQNDFRFTGDFAAKIGKHVHFNIHHNTINYTGIYNSMQAKHRNNAVNLWYATKNDRYKIYGSWLLNNIRNKTNGGITSEDELVAGLFSPRSGVDVNLTTAQLGHKQNSFSLTQFFKVSNIGKKDSINTSPNDDKAEFLLSHQLRYTKETYKFFDTSPAADSSFYGDFQVNDNGLRNFVSYDKINNVFKLELFYKGNLNVGLDHSIYLMNHEPTDTILNNLFLIGNWKLDLDKDFLGLEAKAHYGLLDNRGDYALDVNAFIDFGKFGRLDGRLLSQRFQPNLLQHQLYISKESFWTNDFNKTQETSISASYALPKTRTAVSVQYHLLDNYIYYDSLALPKQHDPVINIFQFVVDQNFKVGNFHLDNTVLLQSVTDDIIRLPRIATKHRLYYKGYLFKRKMLAKLGLIARFNTRFFGDNFSPLTGQFYQQNQQETGYFYSTVKSEFRSELLPMMDAFLNFRVQQFRFFIKVENLNHLALSDVYFTAPLYPIRDWSYRFGVAWTFLD